MIPHVLTRPELQLQASTVTGYCHSPSQQKYKVRQRAGHTWHHPKAYVAEFFKDLSIFVSATYAATGPKGQPPHPRH